MLQKYHWPQVRTEKLVKTYLICVRGSPSRAEIQDFCCRPTLAIDQALTLDEVSGCTSSGFWPRPAGVGGNKGRRLVGACPHHPPVPHPQDQITGQLSSLS